MIYEQALIVEFCGNEAVTSLAELLKDPVDRYRALNLVLDVAGPVEDMDAATIAMFKRFQAALLTMARDWRDPHSHGSGNGHASSAQMPAGTAEAHADVAPASAEADLARAEARQDSAA
jgi:hypothetical protein